MNLSGKCALVTGGTKGIGAATAVALAREGADVAINGRREDAEAQAVLEQIRTCGRRAAMVVADVGKPEEAARCARQAAEALGAVDVLVHSAGGGVPGGLLDTPIDQWYAAFDVHVHALFHLGREVVPLMKQRGGGAIIMISSSAGLRGLPFNLPYQVVKGALPQFARALARMHADDNIRVNCVAPGVIRTRFHEKMTAEQRRINLEQRIPLHREGTPEQVAELILALVRNDYITGETVSIDGGLTMRIA